VTKSKGSEKKPKIAWGKALLVLLVAAWMFVLGVMVGRGTAPVHFDIMALQKEVAALRQAAMKKERTAVETAIRGEDQKATLEFYEKLKNDGLDTAVRAPLSGQTASGLISAGPSGDALFIPHKKRASILAKKNKRSAPDKSKAPSRKRAATSSKGPLTIQVASLKNGSEAGRIVAKLKKEGYSAYLSRIVLPEKGLWFRVRVGSYADARQAAADMERLTKAKKKPILLAK
jgi:cell division septation protein DedD